MLLSFVTLITAMVILVHRPLWERVVLLASAIPIALVSNIIRITATAWCYHRFGHETGEKLAHDCAGWAMMPIALVLVWLELRLMSWLVVEVEQVPSRASSGPGFEGRGEVPRKPPALFAGWPGQLACPGREATRGLTTGPSGCRVPLAAAPPGSRLSGPPRGELASFGAIGLFGAWFRSAPVSGNAHTTWIAQTANGFVLRRRLRRAGAPSSRGVPTHPQRPMMYRAMHGMMKNIQIPIL